MAELVFLVTFILLSTALHLYENHRMNKRMDERIKRVHELNKQIKGDK